MNGRERLVDNSERRVTSDWCNGSTEVFGTSSRGPNPLSEIWLLIKLMEELVYFIRASESGGLEIILIIPALH